MLSQKVAKNSKTLSVSVPKRWLFSLLLQGYQGWLLNWLIFKVYQPLSLVSGFLRSIVLAFAPSISWTQIDVVNLCP